MLLVKCTCSLSPSSLSPLECRISSPSDASTSKDNPLPYIYHFYFTPILYRQAAFVSFVSPPPTPHEIISCEFHYR